VANQKTRLLVALLSLTACSAHALDRLHFKGMTEKDLYYLLTAFQKVNVHYLVTADGNSIILKITKSPKVNEATNAGVLTYFNPTDAEIARIGFEKSNKGRAQVRTAPASRIIQAQFARRNSGPSQNPQEPDFIIFLSAAPKIDVIEYLSTPNQVPVSFKAKDGKDVVLAFLDRRKAMQAQSGLQAKGTKVDRIGLDERAFLAFVLAQAKQGKLVFVQGY